MVYKRVRGCTSEQSIPVLNFEFIIIIIIIIIK